MTAEPGHAPNRAYFAQDGSLHLNGAAVYDSGETNIVDNITIIEGVTASADEINILDGATLDVDELNILDGVTKTAAEINLLVAGVAGGYKVARGVHTQAAASDTVVTGLETVVAALASFDSAPTVKQLFVAAQIGDQAGAPAAGSILIKTFKPTAVNDVTPTAATDFTENLGIAWVAIGA